MRIVSSSDILEDKYGIEEAVRMIKEAGFEGIDYAMSAEAYGDNYLAYAEKINAACKKYGIPVVQLHGPIPKYQLHETEARAEFMKKAARAIEFAGLIGSANCVLHPMRVAKGNHEDQLAINLGEYSPLIPLAEKAGVKIAIENMCSFKVNEFGEPVKHVCKSAEEHAKYIDAFESDAVTACFDTGHAAASSEEICEFVRILGGKRLTALHVHDNDCQHDLHTIPYNHSIKFDPFLTALADIDYQGDFTLECIYYIRNIPEALWFSNLKYQADVARYMRDEVLRRKEIRNNK